MKDLDVYKGNLSNLGTCCCKREMAWLTNLGTVYQGTIYDNLFPVWIHI